MPIIARFYGMVVKMYYLASEHNPPHIHVIYGEYVGVINILNGQMMHGESEEAINIASEWTLLHSEELL